MTTVPPGMVLIVGLAGMTVSGSSPRALVAPLLLLSPLYVATHWYVPVAVGRKPPGLVPVLVSYVPLPLTVTVSVYTAALDEIERVNVRVPVAVKPPTTV